MSCRSTKGHERVDGTSRPILEAVTPIRGYKNSRFYVRPRITGVYRLRYTPSGASYVGSSKRSIANRIGWHISVLRAGKHTCAALQEEWNNSVESDWVVDILEIANPDVVRSREIHWLLQEDTILNTVHEHRVWSPESRQKLRVSAKRVGSDPEERERRRQRALAQHARRRLA